MSLSNPVKTLNTEVARKIAAGEVIDRPNAIIRELMDNAIDSGASTITVEISGGGIEKIRIVDDGCGMTKEDLQACARPHATSKISTETDLMNLSTLGFRGEALASIAAVARLSITSSGWKMRASITEDHILEPVAETKGTIVQSEGLFENFPARRQFLKRPATEGLMCKNTFIEKAMSRPDLAFRFIQDGETKIDLPQNQSLKDRFIQANSITEDAALFYEVCSKSSHNYEASNGDVLPDWQFTVVIGEPAVSRSNKKEISIFTNGRKIQEYALVQAIEYGGQGFFPNGTYPVAAAFIQVNPQQVDFNIHPAKKEARFYDIADLHHGLSSTLKSFFQKYTKANFDEDKPADEIRKDDYWQSSTTWKEPVSFPQTSTPPAPSSSGSYAKHISYKTTPGASHNINDFRSKYLGGTIGSSGTIGTGITTSYKETSVPEYKETATLDLAMEALAQQNNIKLESKVRFIGCCLGTFLLAEKNNCLYIVDQHAVHERILFDKLMNNQTESNRQPLLIPYKIHTESKIQDNQLEKLQPGLIKIGFETEMVKDGEWEVKTIPDRWTGSEYDLRTLLFVKHVEPEEIIRSIAAMTACKAAVKDGYVLDDDTAAKLVEQAFDLPDPHCPHGRPVYTVISREKLFELVKRT